MNSKQQAEHDRALVAWINSGRMCKVAGMAAWADSAKIGMGKPARKLTEIQRGRAEIVKAEQRRSTRARRTAPPPALPSGQGYFPHQGKREIARRARQLAKR